MRNARRRFAVRQRHARRHLAVRQRHARRLFAIRQRHARRLFAIRQLAVWLLAVLALPLGAGTALAHNVLVGSDPANGSSVASGPSMVTLTFDLPVKESFSTVTVVGPDGGHFEGGPATVDGNVVRAPVRALGPAGVYTVGYRIVSDDGHPVSGAIRFTLTQAGPGRGMPAAQTGGRPAGGQPGGGQPAGGQPGGGSAGGGPTAGGSSGAAGVPAWPWVLGGVLLVAAGAAVALRLSRGAGDR
jgi:methionine-rich copper-binding protein CopC